MPLLVDTYNVLHVTGVLDAEHAGPETADLARMVAASRFRSEAVTLVCDGHRSKDAASGTDGVAVRYAGAGVTADEVIVAEILRSTAPRGLTIVTSDRAIRRAARRRGCRLIGSDEFLARLQDDLESARGGSSTTPPQGVPASPAPPVERIRLPEQILREAAALAQAESAGTGTGTGTGEPPPADPTDPGPDRPTGRGTRPGGGISAPPGGRRLDLRDVADRPSSPPPRRPERPAPVRPEDQAPVFGSDVLADVLALEAQEQARRARETAQSQARTARRQAETAEEEAARRDALSEAARTAEAERARQSELDARVLEEAQTFIDPRELDAVDELVRRTVPEEDLPRRDKTFDDDILEQARRLLEEETGEA